MDIFSHLARHFSFIIGILAVLGIPGVLMRVNPANLKDFGFMAMVYDFHTSLPEYKCSGILINSVIVLTTCECIGSFSYDSSLKLIFTPIDWQRFQVRLGFDGRGSTESRYYDIENVRPFEKCTFNKLSNFTYNLGAITLKTAAIISKKTTLSTAPLLIEPTQDEMETRVVEMIYNEVSCIIVGYGSFYPDTNAHKFKLQSVNTRFITFLKCSGRICIQANECLNNVDIANNEEMCASAKDDSDNCSVDKGSPLLCDGYLTGIVKFVSCNHTNSPVLLTRLSSAIDFYNSLTGTSALPIPSATVILILVFANIALAYSE